MSAGVHLELDGPVAIVSLDNPPLNIFDLEMRDGLIEAFTAVRDIPDARVLLLRAEGRHFSAGADLSEFASAESIMEARRIRWDRDPWGVLWELPIPTIAVLHGIAVGSGMEMAMLCDLRLASHDTRLGLPETKLGMLPSAGGSQSLTRAIGPSAAVPVIATSVTLDATEASLRGIVSRVVDDVEDEARRLATTLADVDPTVMRAAKRLVHAAGDLPLADGLALEHLLARPPLGSQ
jgi:enoyl-CoA hydratase/carnithine racemase